MGGQDSTTHSYWVQEHRVIIVPTTENGIGVCQSQHRLRFALRSGRCGNTGPASTVTTILSHQYYSTLTRSTGDN